MALEDNPKGVREGHLPRTPINISTSIIMVSDSLSRLGAEWTKKDRSSKIAEEILEGYGIRQAKIKVIPDEKDRVEQETLKSVAEEANLIITIGGTGISIRDVTVEALSGLFDKELPGFGELFRAESYKAIGAQALMSRATAGIRGKSLIIALPGSPNAVKTGLNLIMPEIHHILGLLNK